MSNLNTKFQASLTQIEWELWIRSSTVKWEFPSRLVIGTHGTRTVTWKKNHGWNSRVPWKLTVKRHLRIHSNTAFTDLTHNSHFTQTRVQFSNSTLFRPNPWRSYPNRISSIFKTYHLSHTTTGNTGTPTLRTHCPLTTIDNSSSLEIRT